jgi:hypothetical protein
MEFCNYNKNIISLYALKTLVTRGMKIEWDESSEDYLFFYWLDLGFTLNNGWIDFEENSVRYRFSTNCPIANVFRWCKFYLTMYWWRYGKG